jgi:hypothetical protein
VAKSTPIDQNKLALAALADCLVKAFGEQDHGFQARFAANLAKAYDQVLMAKFGDLDQRVPERALGKAAWPGATVLPRTLQ